MSFSAGSALLKIAGSQFLSEDTIVADPDPVCIWADRIRILLSLSKNNKKNIDSNFFVTSL
jgi:hypothetical protein